MSQQQSSLLDLPPEIRNEIWKMSVGERQIKLEACNGDECKHITGTSCHFVESVTNRPPGNHIAILCRRRSEMEPWCVRSCALRNPHTEPLSTNLLQTNHQVHNEASSVFYSTNVFHSGCGGLFRHWMSRLTTWQRSQVKAIGVYYSMWSTWHQSIDPLQLPALETIHLEVRVEDGGKMPTPELVKHGVLDLVQTLVDILIANGMKLKEMPISVLMMVEGEMDHDKIWTSDHEEETKLWIKECRHTALQYINADDTSEQKEKWKIWEEWADKKFSLS